MKHNATIQLLAAAFTMPLLIGLILGLPREANAQSRGGQTANLSQDQPLQMEDAEPMEPGQFQLQFTSRYDRTVEREDGLTFLPGMQYGFGHGWQSTLKPCGRTARLWRMCTASRTRSSTKPRTLPRSAGYSR